MKQFVFKHAFSLSIAWALVILIACAFPGQYIPSNDWLDLLAVDKLVHAAMFFILNSLLFIVTIKKHKSGATIVLLFLICVAYGVLLEIMQANFFSNRSSDIMDVAANSAGCIISLFFLSKLKKIYH